MTGSCGEKGPLSGLNINETNDKDFTYEFNIIYMEPVLGKTFKMFNKHWLISVLIRKHPSTWMADTLHAEHACLKPGSLLGI